MIKKFHTESTQYFQNGIDEHRTGGGFYRMNSKVHAKIAKSCQPLFVPKGSLCIWDNRLPHKTSHTLSGNDTREVVYCSFLPNVDINKRYVANQLTALQQNISPPQYFDANNKREIADRDWEESNLTNFQKHYLGS